MTKKVALITDLHFGARNDSLVFHEYYSKFYTEIFIPYLLEHKIDTVFCLGDTFDKRKQINFISLDKSMEYFFDPLQKHGIQLYCLVGNHDAPFKNHIRVSSPKLLLSSYKNIQVIDQPTEITVHDTDFLFVPWICADNQTETLTALKKTTANIFVGHLELSGFEMFKGQVSEHGHLEVKDLKKFKTVWSGHYHHRSTKDNITYLGNPYELTWSDYDDPRGFHVYDADTELIEFVPNTFKMFHKFFYDDENMESAWYDDVDYSQYANAHVKVIVTKKTDFLAFDTFIHKLQEVSPAELKIIEDFSEFEESAIDEEQLESEDTLTLLNGYIDGIATDIDREELKRVMRELYTEANIDG